MRRFAPVFLTALALNAGALDWHLPPGTRIEGDTLVAEIAPDATGRRDARASAGIDVSDALAAGLGVTIDVRYRASGVTEPDHSWNGVKVQLRYTDLGGTPQYPAAETPRGTFDWTNATVRLSALANPRGVESGRATLLLGLEGCAGRAEFDLDSLRIATEDPGIPRVNGDYVVRYSDDTVAADANEGVPQGGAMKGAALQQMKCAASQQMKCAPAAQMNDNPSFAGTAGTIHFRDADPSFAGAAGTIHFRDADPSFAGAAGTIHSAEGGPSLHAAAQRRRPLRGCMLPARATAEDDIETLHRWGATLVRFQIVRDWLADDADRDLAEYARWIDSRLDNLADVLRWCAARGMKVCVDLHSPPGGRRRGDRELGMMRDDRYADAFVETWRRIAARFKGHPALYGYDLVNEPKQLRRVRNDYWTLQRRAAEAVREIDPATPIVVESNLSASPADFARLSPLAMDNVIYQLHLYAPGDYTHQGVGSHPLQKDGRPLAWPDPTCGRDRDCLRRVLEPVREFQGKHQCRIYVGEFSAVAWAPGADAYLRDCIALFDEYGWDWTYHAFREWPPWSVEHDVAGPGKPSVPSADNPRKRALLEGLAK